MTGAVGVIRIERPVDLRRVLVDLRAKTGFGTYEIAQRIAADTGQSPESVRVALWRWETGRTRNPDLFLLLPVLRWHGYDLALVPREDFDA